MTPRSLRQKGFTLIELLIVITIIGILAVALIPRLTGGPARARDAQREADLQQIATALEFQYQDNGSYPFYEGCVSLNTNLSSYLTTIPTDPSVTSTGGVSTGEFTAGDCTTGYAYYGLKSSGGGGPTGTYAATGGTGYILIADLETETVRLQGVYNVASAVTFTYTNSAATNMGASGLTSCATSCTSTNVVYMMGR